MRLLIHVEGQTEESFVNEILREPLVNAGYESVSARMVGNARLRRRRCGIRPWPSVKQDIVEHLKQDGGCITTTMVDFYALPQTGDGAWPGRAHAGGLPVARKAPTVEKGMYDDVAKEIDPHRFVPFVIMHEFEGLLFSDCAAFSRGIARPELEQAFQQIRDDFDTPEDINDSPVTAPSKRIERLVNGYEKPLLGTLAILEIGLEGIRRECAHFNKWMQRLESMNR